MRISIFGDNKVGKSTLLNYYRQKKNQIVNQNKALPKESFHRENFKVGMDQKVIRVCLSDPWSGNFDPLQDE